MLFCKITDTSFETPTVINGRKYFVKRDKTFLTGIKKHLLLDFESNEKICEIQHHIHDAKVLAVFPNNEKHEFTYETGNPAQTNGLVAQLYDDRLEVRASKNIEALIISYFYSRSILNA